LTEILRDLRNAATDGHWSIDWKRLDALSEQAAAAAAASDFSQAARCCCQAISFMMAELKQQGKAHNGPAKP
jgi:hypothetical protein